MARQEIRLPSGSTLSLGIAPFADAKALLRAVTEELRSVPFGRTVDHEGIVAQAILIACSSPLIEQCLWKCMAKCVIDDAKITEETFEPEAKRDDWLIVVAAVMRANLNPFTKSLWQEFVRILEVINGFQKPKS